MILKKLIIKNIRSYKSAEINFPEGSTLLMGDIGSGKTSALLAIEFALFGLQPSQRGNSLLRNNEEEAFVRLEMLIENKSIILERKLKRSSKSISQGEASITIDGLRQEGSVTEIKNKVLEIMNYPQEFAKKTNDLYKFTVYTPQEEMKQIILEPKDTRLNTLRHIFGIDKYKRIEENLDIFTKKLRQEIRFKEVQLQDIEKKKQELLEKHNFLDEKSMQLKQMQDLIERANAERLLKEQEIKELEDKINEKNNLEKEKAKSEVMLANKSEALSSSQKQILLLQEQVKELKKFNLDNEKEPMLRARIDSQEKIYLSINEEYNHISLKLQSYEPRKKELLYLKTKIQGLEQCPTCLQEVNQEYKKNILNKADEELNVLMEQAEIQEKEKQIVKERMESVKKQLDAYKSALSELEILKVKLQNLEEKEKAIAEINNQNKRISKDVILLQKHVKDINSLIEDLAKYSRIYEEKNKQLKEKIASENRLYISKAEINKEIQFLEQQINDINKEIEKIKEMSKKINHLKELEFWLNNNFLQLILNTEKTVMLKLRQEFSNLFSDWFSILVSDSLSVRLDESFSPVIEQQDYELDYNYLSGGERTAIALAYRLSLNQVINSLLSKIKTRDLVILDEPTDGFSEAQLDKMRDVLAQLNVKQLILVSHEQKMESFVDNIIRFRKIEGVTEVEK